MNIEALNPTVIIGLLIASFTVITIAIIIYRAEMKHFEFQRDEDERRTERYKAERAADDARYRRIAASKATATDSPNLTTEA